LRVQPDHPTAVRNLQVLYARVQQLGQMKSPPSLTTGAQQGPVPTFEIGVRSDRSARFR